MALQVYESLPHPSSIRLIQYLPTGNPDEISISLTVHQLDSAPVYLSISYVWGNLTEVKTIICNGHRLKISPALFSALQRVHARSPNLPIWADAICINQLNDEERSQQVAIMGKIFKQATAVLVHIPDTQQNCSEVRALVNDIKGLIENSGGLENMRYLSPDDPLLTDRRWESATLFKLKPWFSRTWVIQEVGMASDPRILYGDCEFSYRDWVLLESWALKYAPQLDTLWKFPMGTIHGAALDWFREDFSLNTNFIDLFSTTGRLACSDARDHVYALLAHPLARIPGRKGPIVNPDYTKPASDVFYDLAVQMLQLPEGLRTLSAVQHHKNGPPVGYPSWVPFWDMSGHRTMENSGITLGTCHYHYYNASSGLGHSYYVVTNDRALLLRGIFFDRLASVYQLEMEDFEIPSRQSDACSNGGILESIHSVVTDSGSPSPMGATKIAATPFQSR